MITLVGDTSSNKPPLQSSKTAVYVFELLPLNIEWYPIVLHLRKTKNSVSCQEITTMFS